MAPTKISLKLVMDKKSKRVLFAEADKEFIDFLFNFLTLPFGNITGILKEKGMGGCLPSLFKSIENLSDAYFLPDQPKDFVLNPLVAIPGPKVPLLFPNVESFMYSEPSHINYCSDCSTKNIKEMICFPATRSICASCRLISFAASSRHSASPPSSSDKGYVKGMVRYMVMDDLEVKPMFNVSFLTMLNQFNVEHVGAIEEKVVELGLNEVWQSSLNCFLCITTIELFFFPFFYFSFW
jgi:hypothetical protein